MNKELVVAECKKALLKAAGTNVIPGGGPPPFCFTSDWMSVDDAAESMARLIMEVETIAHGPLYEREIATLLDAASGA